MSNSNLLVDLLNKTYTGIVDTCFHFYTMTEETLIFGIFIYMWLIAAATILCIGFMRMYQDHLNHMFVQEADTGDSEAEEPRSAPVGVPLHNFNLYLKNKKKREHDAPMMILANPSEEDNIDSLIADLVKINDDNIEEDETQL